MENGNRLPELTDEQRKAALARAAQARRERTELPSTVKMKRRPPVSLVTDERCTIRCSRSCRRSAT